MHASILTANLKDYLIIEFQILSHSTYSFSFVSDDMYKQSREKPY